MCCWPGYTGQTGAPHRSDRCATPVRPVQVWTDNILGFVLVQILGLYLEVVVLVVGLESLQVVSLLDVPPSCSIRGWEES
jgi:hypothetical protein